MPQLPPLKTTGTAKVLLWLLGIVLTIRISSYMTFFPDSITMTRIFKIGLRFTMTGLCMFFLLRFRRYQPTKKLHMMRSLPMGFYLLYLFMGIASVFWTTNVPYTLLQWAMTFENFVFSVFFYQCILFYDEAYRPNDPSMPILLAMSIFVTAIFFVHGCFMDPDTYMRKTHGGDVARLGGFIINPNELGMLMAVGVTCIGYEWLNRGVGFINILAFLTCTFVLLMTQSRSSLGAYLLIIGLFVIKSRYYWLKFGAVAGAFFALPVLFQTVILKQGNWEEVASMTGRMPFWKDLLTYGFPERPIIGYGFMSISQNSFTDKFDSIHAYAASMTHNTFIQVLINLGLVGATICLLQMAFTIHAISTTKNSALQWLAATMLIPLIINSLTEFGIFGETNHGILFYVFIILFFTYSVKTVKRV
ncbi:MAG: O-antigen ligase family protein [Bacteroidota bacterium]